MLNECQEYELYLTKGYGGIIRRDNMADSLAGLRPVLTLLARGFIEDCRNTTDDKETLLVYMTVFLKIWLMGEEAAFDEKIADELKKNSLLAEKLKRAENANLLDFMANKEKIKREEWKTILCKKIKEWDYAIFREGKDSLNAIRFKTIFADALYQGALRNHWLRIRSNKKNHGLQGDFSNKKFWQVLMIVAAYLQYKPADCQSTLMVMATLSNTIGIRTKVDGKGGTSIQRLTAPNEYTYQGRPLFVKRLFASSGYKMSVDAGWLRDYNVQTVPINTQEEVGYILYKEIIINNRVELINVADEKKWKEPER